MEERFSDPVGLVEALYRFDLSTDAWLGLVLGGLSPLLDRDHLGIFGGFYGCPDPVTFAPTCLAERGVSDELRAIFQEGLAALPPVFVAGGLLCRSWFIGDEVEGWQDISAVRSGALAAQGLRNMLVLNAVEPDGSGCSFFSFWTERRRLPGEARLAFTRIARHLAAAHRVRRRLGETSVSAQIADAVLEPGGRVRHAGASAKGRAERELLGRAALAMDRARSRQGRRDSLQAIQSWQGLVGPGWTLVEHFERDGRRYILAIDNRPKGPSFELLSVRERELVRLAVRGLANKEIAFSLGLASSTVRVLMARAAAKVGVHSRRELLEMAASASWNGRGDR
jgi:DNA-binding CsgD family transcriptional regulator